MVAQAPTLSYEVGLCNDGAVPTGSACRAIGCPVLALAGADSPDWASDGATAIAAAVPDGLAHVLRGQDHNVSADAVAPLLADSFAASRTRGNWWNSPTVTPRPSNSPHVRRPDRCPSLESEMSTVFITGSADGLGAMAARRLIAEGHEVVLHARSPQRAQEAHARGARAQPRRCTAISPRSSRSAASPSRPTTAARSTP